MTPGGTAGDLLRRPVGRLWRDWLARAEGQVADYLANNGKEPPRAERVAAACPALRGRERAAAWFLARAAGNGGSADNTATRKVSQ
jgi:hypothetical protein